MTLKGLRVLNTRPAQQAQALSQAIFEAGGVSISLPALAIEPLGDQWLNHLPELSQVKQSIFISSNAVHYFFEGLKQHELNWPSTIKISAVGKATAAALAHFGLTKVQVPLIADSEHLLLLESLQNIHQQTILIIKGEEGRKDLAETLLMRGAKLISLAVYRRVLPKLDQELIRSLWRDDAVDIILCTSQQAIQNLFILFGDEGRSWLCHKPCLVISKRLAKFAQSLGMHSVELCDYDKILHGLERYNKDHS